VFLHMSHTAYPLKVPSRYAQIVWNFRNVLLIQVLRGIVRIM